MVWLTLHVCTQSGHQVSNSCSNMIQSVRDGQKDKWMCIPMCKIIHVCGCSRVGFLGCSHIQRDSGYETFIPEYIERKLNLTRPLIQNICEGITSYH